MCRLFAIPDTPGDESLKYLLVLPDSVSKQVGRVDTLFLHETGDDFLVVVRRDGERVLRGRLVLKETSAGPRPGKFRLTRGSTEDPRDPDQFV